MSVLGHTRRDELLRVALNLAIDLPKIIGEGSVAQFVIYISHYK